MHTENGSSQTLLGHAEHRSLSAAPDRAVRPREARTVTVEEAATIIGIGRTLAYQRCRDGSIPSIRIGRRLLVSRAALERLLG